ncbi:hypothetical protein P154DRAFT_578565 [Amniculicola lignicola CBS 123094]|uniref:Uncharacterized protein n=1 Tax=Amniculicola lignicola CBS 123094 TaxID=1392246 RepID=A0A6A5WAL8_9PLEO|nr:hypothetical protein P154DRAFT_578565 [Amniculicola lignicola CBS 123094]
MASGVTWSGMGTGTLVGGTSRSLHVSGANGNNTSFSLFSNTTRSTGHNHTTFITALGAQDNSTISTSFPNPIATNSDPSSTALRTLNSTLKSTLSYSTSILSTVNSATISDSLNSGTANISRGFTPTTTSTWLANDTTTSSHSFLEAPSVSQSTSTASNGSLVLIPIPIPITNPDSVQTRTGALQWVEATNSPDPSDPSLLTGITWWDEFEVTQTETVKPSSMSVDTITNRDWSKNFWLSTTGSSGKPTELPVVHCGCICQGNCDSDDDDDDDGLFVWVVFWNVPKRPNVQFSFPKLPDFHFPKCIKIFGISLGKCPPKSDNGRKKNKNKDPDDPKNRNREPNDPEDGDDKCETKSVVTDTKFSTVCPRSSAPPPDCSTTSITSQRTGCDIQPTTTSTSTVSCRTGVVTDTVTQTLCPTQGANSRDCSTTMFTSVRTGCDITASNSATFTETCSPGLVTDMEVKTVCSASGTLTSTCSTTTKSVVRTGRCLTASVSFTYSSTSNEACGFWTAPIEPYQLSTMMENSTAPACGIWTAPSEPYQLASNTSALITTTNSRTTASHLSVTGSSKTVTATRTSLMTSLSTSSGQTDIKSSSMSSMPSSSSASSPTPIPPNPIPRDPDECYHRYWGAPKMEADEATVPAFHRITKFCSDNHDVEVGKDFPDDRYVREDLSSWGIPKRQSYWIRANAAPFTQCATGVIDKQDCIAVLYNALDKCDPGDITYGVRAQGGGCVQYTLDVSDVVNDDEPPWNEHVAHYPGIERPELHANEQDDTMPQTPCPNNPDCQMNDIQCKVGSDTSFDMADADQAIEEYCNTKGKHSEVLRVLVNHFAVVSYFDPEKYMDEKYCLKPVDQDGKGEFVDEDINLFDCKYALTKMVHHCNDYNPSTSDGRWYYRCVEYKFTTTAAQSFHGITIPK